MSTQKITPFLWFDGNLDEALDFYTSIFKNAKVTMENRMPPKGLGEKGQLFTATFELEGQEFMGLNGGPMFQFTEAVSFFVKCETQEEVDYYWDNLLKDGGKPSQCGWLKDRFGVSWQVVPNILGQLLNNSSDTEKAKRVMQAMMKMVKMDVKGLEEA